MCIYGGRDGTDDMMVPRASVCTSPRQVGSRGAEVWLGLGISGCEGVRLWPYQEGLIRFSDPIAAMLYSLFLILDSSTAIPCFFISPVLPIQIQVRLPFHPHEKSANGRPT